jgi:DUF1016 N-terminal domain
MIGEARKNGMLGAEEAATLTEVPNMSQKGTRLGNWLTREQAKELLAVPDRSTLKGKTEAAEWGDGVVDRLAQFIARTEPGLRGLTRRNLFIIRQLYEAYRGDSIVSPLVGTIAVVSSSDHPGAEQMPGRMRILCTTRHPRAVE